MNDTPKLVPPDYISRPRSFGTVVLFAFVVLTMLIGLAGLAYARGFVDAGVVSDAAVATAPSIAPSIDGDPAGFFAQLYRNVRSGEWLPFAGGALLLISWVMLKVFSSVKGAGATLLVGVLALAGALGTAWFAGEAFDWTQIKTALTAAVAAMGGWAVVKNVILGWLIPKIRGLFAKGS